MIIGWGRIAQHFHKIKQLIIDYYCVNNVEVSKSELIKEKICFVPWWQRQNSDIFDDSIETERAKLRNFNVFVMATSYFRFILIFGSNLIYWFLLKGFLSKVYGNIRRFINCFVIILLCHYSKSCKWFIIHHCFKINFSTACLKNSPLVLYSK